MGWGINRKPRRCGRFEGCRGDCGGRGKRALGLVCLAGLLFLSACGDGGGGTDFSYADQAFAVEVQGVFCRTAPDGYGGNPSVAGASRTGVEVPFAAAVTVEASADSTGPENRAVTVVFHDPPALRGVVVCRRDGAVTVSLEGSGLSAAWAGTNPLGGANPYRELLRAADMLIPAGDVVKITPTVNGEKRITTEIPPDGLSDSTGSTGSTRTEWTFRTGRDLPVRVRVVTGDRYVDASVSPAAVPFGDGWPDGHLSGHPDGAHP